MPITNIWPIMCSLFGLCGSAHLSAPSWWSCWNGRCNCRMGRSQTSQMLRSPFVKLCCSTWVVWQQMEGMASGSIFFAMCWIADSSIIQPESLLVSSSHFKHSAGSWFLRWVPLHSILFSRLLGALHSDEARGKVMTGQLSMVDAWTHRQVKKTLQTGAISLAEVDSLLQRFHLLGHTGAEFLGHPERDSTKTLL